MSIPSPRRALPLLLALLAMSGCRTPSADPAAVALENLPAGTDWALEASDVAGLDRPEAGSIRLHLEADRLSGDSGCNRFSAAYSLDGGKLQIGPAAATKRGCPGPSGEIEQRLFELLPTLSSASMEGDALVLRAADGGHLRFLPVTGDK